MTIARRSLVPLLVIAAGACQSSDGGTPGPSTGPVDVSADQMDFINQAVTLQNICGGAVANGWYPKLVFGDSTKFHPTIADVHTQLTDEAGNVVGRVLHVGTGYPRLMVITREACSGPRAYAGLVFSYYEKVTENFERLTDDKWAAEFNTTSPADVPG